MMKSLGLFLFSIAALTTYASEIPDFSANYLVQLNGLQAGELKRSLSTQDNGTRLFKSETQAKGVFAFFKPDLVEESSVFQSHGDLIIPLSYLYQRSGGKKDKYLSLDFNWQQQQVHIDDKKQPWSLAIEPSTLDKLVYQLVLMSDLNEDKAHYSYRIADGGKLKTFNINIIEHELISTPLGQIDTMKLIRERQHSKGRQTILWCAPALHYLPVKLEHTEKGGSVFTAILRRLKGIDTSTAFTTSSPRTPEF